MSTRRMTRADLDDVYVLDKQMFSPAYSKRSLRSLYVHPNTEAFVFEVENNIVGYLFASKDMFAAEVIRLGVLSQFRNSGVGKSLLARLETAIGPDMSIEVRTNSEEVAMFLQHCNFKCVAQYESCFLFRCGWRFLIPPQEKYRLTS